LFGNNGAITDDSKSARSKRTVRASLVRRLNLSFSKVREAYRRETFSGGATSGPTVTVGLMQMFQRFRMRIAARGMFGPQ
jgi:hypothetical protein